MPNLNKIMIMGHVGKDPECGVKGDFKYCNFSVAVSDSYKDKKTGEKVKTTEWFNVVAFGKLAELAGDYIKKGNAIFVEGKQKTDKYNDATGIEKTYIKLIANDFRLLTPRDTQVTAKVDTKSEETFDDQDIPF